MKLRSLALAVLASTSFSAHAALTEYAPWNAQLPNLAGVQFNVASAAAGGYSIAMGAHPFKLGVTMPNDGVSSYTAALGTFETNRANWSFDYAWDLSGCTGCSVSLFVDVDASSGVNMQQLGLVAPTASTYAESWNMEMTFIDALLYNFDPFSASSTAFSLRLNSAAGAELLRSDITVNALDATAVPEPTSIALFGLGLIGMGAVARRRKAK